MRKKKVLVTGAHGFLGKNVSKYFSDKGWRVLGIGHGTWERDEKKVWGIDRWIESDINNKSLQKLNELPDVIVHAAGSGSVEYSFNYPKKDFESNFSSVLPVLDFIKMSCPNTRLIYPSSVAVYGDVGDRQIKEITPLKPVSPYGLNKKKTEELLKTYSKKFSEKISVIRFFSIYGAGLRKQLLWDACEKIRQSTNSAVFFGTGEETRDWINIKDACSLIYKLTTSKKRFEILNGASGKRVEIRKLLELLVKYYGKNVKIVFSGKQRKGDPRFYYADISKALNLGWRNNVSLESGIQEYVDYFKKNT